MSCDWMVESARANCKRVAALFMTIHEVNCDPDFRCRSEGRRSTNWLLPGRLQSKLLPGIPRRKPGLPLLVPDCRRFAPPLILIAAGRSAVGSPAVASAFSAQGCDQRRDKEEPQERRWPAIQRFAKRHY